MHNLNSEQKSRVLQIARNTINLTANSIQKIGNDLPKGFPEIVQLLYDCSGKVIVTGIGKSALIAQKISATFNSTGTVSAYLHAADALHGDLGMVQKNDIIIALSKSGNTQEIIELCKYAKRNDIKTVALTSSKFTSLAKIVNHSLFLPLEREADPNNLAPTTSSCLQLVIGDALALCLSEIRGFKAKDFGKFHPAGSLGKLIHLKLSDLYIKNPKPVVDVKASLNKLIIEISKKRMGATAVLDGKQLVGIITDGDLRRMLEKNNDLSNVAAEDIMTKFPMKFKETMSAHEALQKMEEKNISQILVVENDNASNYLGMIHLHDLIKLGLE